MLLALENENDTVAFGKKIAEAIQGDEIIFLQGDLGAGKTTLVRGFLHALGYSGKVKSPTYTLIEPYLINGKNIYHFDLYRINDPEELESMGIRDYCDGESVCLYEWSERGQGVLPEADLILSFRSTDSGREVTLQSKSDKGSKVIASLESNKSMFKAKNIKL